MLFWNGTPVDPQKSPVKAADALFGGITGTPPPVSIDVQLRKDLLAFTGSEIQTLQKTLTGLTREQTKLATHLSAIQALQSDSSMTSHSSCTTKPSLPSVEMVRAASAGNVVDPSGSNDYFYQAANFPLLLQAQLELVTQALICNAAPIIGLMPMYATCDFDFGFAGAPGAHHNGLSHTGPQAAAGAQYNSPITIANLQAMARAPFATAQKWFMTQLVNKVVSVQQYENGSGVQHHHVLLAIQFWRGLTLPYVEAGVRLIRQADIEAFVHTMEGFREELTEAEADLNAVYEQIKADARRRLGRLYNPADYPPEVRGLFAVDWDFPSVEPPSYLLRLEPGRLPAGAGARRRRFEEAVQLAEQAFVAEFAKLVSHLTERLAAGPDGEREGLPRLGRQQPDRVLRAVQARSTSARSPQLDELVEQAQQLVRGVAPQDLRDNDALRQHVASAAAPGAGRRWTGCWSNGPGGGSLRSVASSRTEAAMQLSLIGRAGSMRSTARPSTWRRSAN